VIPEETGGPYPADGTNTHDGSIINVLNQSGVVRSDIRAGFNGATGGRRACRSASDGQCHAGLCLRPEHRRERLNYCHETQVAMQRLLALMRVELLKITYNTCRFAPHGLGGRLIRWRCNHSCQLSLFQSSS